MKLELIKQKCIEANPEIVINENAQLIKFDHSVEYFVQTRPITLADVLMAIDKKIINERGVRHTQYMINTQGQLAEYGILGKILMSWNLKEPLENQSEDTINFLYELLK